MRSRRGTGYNADIVGPSPSIPPTYRRPRRYHDTSHDRNAMAAVLQGMVRGKNTRRVGGRHGSLIAAARGLTSEHEAGGAAAPTGGAEASCATQVGGHAGSFEASSAGHLVKETNHKERRAYEAISADAKLAAWAPKYDGSITIHDKEDPTQIDTHHVKLRLQDVTRGLRAPCVMDIKLGTRTFAESEVADTRCRKDLVEKMLIEVGLRASIITGIMTILEDKSADQLAGTLKRQADCGQIVYRGGSLVVSSCPLLGVALL